MVKAVGFIKDATKQLGKAMTQVTETFEKFSDDNDSIAGQSHAQLGRIVSGGSGVYAFASRATSLKDYVLLDNQSTDKSSVILTLFRIFGGGIGNWIWKVMVVSYQSIKLPTSRDLSSLCGLARRP